MTETSITAWAWMLAAMLASSGAGLALVRFVPWSEAARKAGIPRGFAFAIAPFLLGLLSVIALGVFRGSSHAFHLGVVFTGLLLLCSTAVISPPLPKHTRSGMHIPVGGWEWAFGALLAAWVVFLIVDTLFMPLTQNDALEYATVGRLLFQLRDLTVYPVLDPTLNNSGFYGPWTHPPLYVAMIYLGYLFQGHADAPGLIRLIAPWFALGTTGLVYTMGRLESRLAGLVASLICISTPLFFLGAGSALIDPLPVLGMTLMLCSIVAVEGTPLRRGLIQGLTLGVGLWTHSQAVLFVPIAVLAIILNSRWKDIRSLLLQICILLIVAGLLSAIPYWRNFKLFGSFISDNPAVFAMKELGWVEYFSKARGLESLAEKLQYGVFKGWFAFESYSWAFWLMLPGIVRYLVLLSRHNVLRKLFRGNASRLPEPSKFVILVVIFCYLSGVLVSMAFGIDLMIRNERYLLVLLPCVSIFAGSSISWILIKGNSIKILGNRVSKNIIRLIIYIFTILLVLVLFFQLIVVGGHRWKTLRLSPSQVFLSHEEKLKHWPGYIVAHFIKTNLPQDTTILSLKPADMYFAQRRMLSYLDPRLLPFYGEKNIKQAYLILKNLGVQYIHIPNYSLPTIYNSALMDILGRTDLTHLVFSVDGYQIYQLLGEQRKYLRKSIDISPGVIVWTQQSYFVFGGRKGIVRIPLSSRMVRENQVSYPGFKFSLFQRELSTQYFSGGGGNWEEPAMHDKISVEGSQEYQIDFFLKGNCYAQVFLTQFDSNGQFIRGNMANTNLIGEIAITRKNSPQHFTRRVITQPNADSMRIIIEHRGQTQVYIEHASLAHFIKKENE